MPYSSIDWNAARNQIAKEDLYYPHPIVQVGSVRVLVCVTHARAHCAGSLYEREGGI